VRAPFDRFMDIYYGPATTTPGALKYSELASRVVPDIAFVDTQLPLQKSRAYYTTEDLTPIGAMILNPAALQYNYNFGFADQVALTHGGPITHVVLRVELRTWHTGLPYWRAHIAPLLDILPTVCQISYAEEYMVQFFPAAPFGPFVRIGPTTWIFGAWTLQAEITPASPLCGSTWHLTNADPGFWVAFWNGAGSAAFACSTGCATATVIEV